MKNNQTISPAELIEISAVAHRLSVSVETVRRLIHRKALPALKVHGRYQIDRADMERFISERRIAEAHR